MKLCHADTDPLPLKKKGKETDKEKEKEKQRKLPQAIVVSGLHQTTTAAQLALSSALREGEIELDGERVTLPNDFFLIYVCVGSLTDRPALHSSLVSHPTLAEKKKG